MIQKDIDSLLQKIKKEYQVFAPIRKKGASFIEKIENGKTVDYSGAIPFDSWKFLFFPTQEILLNENFKEPKVNYPKICAWGMNVLDLKALGLLDLVFEDDPYYQKRRQNTLAVGLSAGAPSRENFEDFKIFSLNLEENVLEHVPFDIFLEKMKDGKFLIYSGSQKGQRILEKNKIRDYENIQFAGLIQEEGPDKRMLELQQKMKKSFNNKVWDELDKICLACGKCSIVCPTCFCYDISDEVLAKNEVKRLRKWGNCFYPEFTEIAGGFDFTDTVKKKIHFWYEHKFVRIPKEYKVPGCVSCMRCFKVCPVAINIIEVLKKLDKSSPARKK
ncbi:4Fe-4S dicluster domain-containing protein [Patescibacteria group bacterium]|nr:4Fe-4S dicluster domain-containing protein [Patescibacteria group bacterium]